MFVGQGIDRRDAGGQSLGQAKYAAEVPVSGMVHAVLVRSTIPAGTVAVGRCRERRKAMPGVLDILTAENAEKLNVKGGPQQAVHFPLLQGSERTYSMASTSRWSSPTRYTMRKPPRRK